MKAHDGPGPDQHHDPALPGEPARHFAVLLSIPLSAVAARSWCWLYLMGSTINTMILGGLALAFRASSITR
jgi:hypothetical protein